jgi:Zn2+/Cd2+-exporting ATPase
VNEEATAQLELSLLLPDVSHVRDRCVHRLSEALKAREGVSEAHIREKGAGEGVARLCVHYDTRVLSLEQLRAIAQAHGAEISEQVGHALWQVDALRSQRRARRISEQIRKFPGVIEAVANATGPLRLEYDRSLTNEQTLRSALRGLGVTVDGADSDARPSNEHGHRHGPSGKYAELLFVALCGALLLSGWLLPKFAETPEWVSLSIFIPAYFFGGFFAVREAWTSIRRGRFEIDFLMLAAAAGAGALGAWDEGALLLFLFSLGHALEGYAMGRAKNAIAALGDLTPKVATVRRDGGTEVIAIDELSVGDTVIIKPNERIAADGFVIVGQSSVNQAPITGESVPVDKSPVASPSEAARRPQAVDAASQVLAGTINGSGVLEIQVTRASGDSTLARVVALVSEAQTNQSPTQRLTERFERIFVPSVLVFTGLLLGAGLVIDEPFSATFYRAMAVLVAASPCALAIATPSAVLSGVARAARGGVLVKGGAPLEQLGRLKAIAFDKTGTLTEGKPRLVDVVAADGVSKEELLRIAIAVEKLSDHPLAAAVVRDGVEQLTTGQELTATGLRSITGRGVQASVDGEAVYVGKRHLFDEIQGPPMPEALRSKVDDLEQGGRTTMVIRMGSRYLGVLGLMDTPRAAARSVIESLRKIGVRRMLMISGDNQRVADAVAKEVGLDEALGDLMPDDKVETIKSLRSEAQVAMVGDGVNDAPAMVSATVGIAMGAAGSDVALETADVALMADNLNHLPFAAGLSRAASRVIRQNLWLSLGIVALLIPATLFGLGLGPAVMVHEGSTLVVVANALRLLRFQPRVEM